MKLFKIILFSSLLIIAYACQEKKVDEQISTEHFESTSEHQRDYKKGEGEESGTELTLNEKYDNVRNGARLILTYEAESKSFVGSVENTTENMHIVRRLTSCGFSNIDVIYREPYPEIEYETRRAYVFATKPVLQKSS